jgi:hypothetical protein
MVQTVPIGEINANGHDTPTSPLISTRIMRCVLFQFIIENCWREVGRVCRASVAADFGGNAVPEKQFDSQIKVTVRQKG